RVSPRLARPSPAPPLPPPARPPPPSPPPGAFPRARPPPAAADALGWAAGTPAMNAERQPLVSVVVPARDEEHTLDRCLSSIVAQHWPADRLQVVVVENGSRDRTRAVAAAWAARGPPGPVLLSPAAHPGGAVNPR